MDRSEVVRELLKTVTLSELIAEVPRVFSSGVVIDLSTDSEKWLSKLLPLGDVWIRSTDEILPQLLPLIPPDQILVPKSPRTPTTGPVRLQLPKSHAAFIAAKCTECTDRLVPLDHLYSIYCEDEVKLGIKPVVRNTFKKSLEDLKYIVVKLTPDLLARYPQTVVDSKCSIYTNCVWL